MPFLRAGKKRLPPKPEEPKQEESGVVAAAEPEVLPEIAPAVETIEHEPENEPAPVAEEPSPDVKPVAVPEEPSPDVEPAPAAKETLPDIEPVVETVEPLPEIEPVPVAEEPLPDVEAVPAAEELSPEIEPAPIAEESSPDVEAIPDTEEHLPDVEPAPVPEEPLPNVEHKPDTSGLPAEILEAVGESPAPEPESEPDSGQDSQPTSHTKDYSGETLNYDFTSGERYVDKVSTKTEFDKMLDELSAISKDLLAHEVEKFAVKFTGKFQGDSDKAEADAKKYEAFLGGYITNAAMTLYDNGYRDSAIKQLEQAKSILEARKKLEEETEATRTRVAENDDTVDLTDILGLFGD